MRFEADLIVIFILSLFIGALALRGLWELFIILFWRKHDRKK